MKDSRSKIMKRGTVVSWEKSGAARIFHAARLESPTVDRANRGSGEILRGVKIQTQGLATWQRSQ
jgi:hypothetical protein